MPEPHLFAVLSAFSPQIVAAAALHPPSQPQLLACIPKKQQLLSSCEASQQHTFQLLTPFMPIDHRSLRQHDLIPLRTTCTNQQPFWQAKSWQYLRFLCASYIIMAEDTGIHGTLRPYPDQIRWQRVSTPCRDDGSKGSIGITGELLFYPSNAR